MGSCFDVSFLPFSVVNGATSKLEEKVESFLLKSWLHVETAGCDGAEEGFEEAVEEDVVDTDAAVGYLCRLAAELSLFKGWDGGELCWICCC